MTDIVSLGIKIDSTDVGRAKTSLDDLAQSGEKAEASVKKVASASEVLASAARLAAGAFVAMKILDHIKEVSLLNARYETLGVSMYVVGGHAGYTSAQMDAAETALRKTGISMVEARQQAMRLVQAHIDLADSTKLARIAQDAAVIGGINSSEAFDRMIHGITTGQTEILRGIGINVSMEQSYKTMAASLHKHVDMLSQNEKMQAVVNAVMEKGKDIAGAYEAAMDTAGKQITSMARYTEDLKVKQGEVFNETLTIAVMAWTAHLKDANGEIDELAQNRELEAWGAGITNLFAALADNINNLAGALKIVGLTIAATAAMSANVFNPAAVAAIREAYDSDVTAVLATQDRFSKAVEDRRTALDEKKAKVVEAEKAHQESMTNIMLYYTNLRINGMLTEEQYLKTVTALNDQANDGHRYADTQATKPLTGALSEYQKLIKAIKEKTAAQEIEIALGENATVGQKSYAKLLADITGGYLKLKPAEIARLATLHDQNLENERAISLATRRGELEKSFEMEAAEIYRAWSDAHKDELAQLQKEIEQQEEHNATIGLSKEALAKYTDAKYADAIATKERELAVLKGTPADEAQLSLIRSEIAALETLRSLKMSGAMADIATDAAKKADESWKKTAETIERSLTDALMRGFESGKGFGENMRDAIVNMFKTMVLRPVIQGVVQGGLSAIGLGGGTAGGASGAAGGLGGIANLASTGSSLFNIGSMVSGGYGALPGTTALANASGMLGGDTLGNFIALNPQWTAPVAGEVMAGGEAVAGGSSLGGMSFMGPAAVVAGMLMSGAFYNQGYRWDAQRNTAIDPGFTVNTRIAEAFGLSGHTAAMITGSSLIQRLLGKPGGPKSEGNAFATIIDQAGALRTESTATGGDGRWYTGSSADAQMAELIKPIGATIADYIKSLGGNATGLGINLGYNHDGQGDAPDNISAGLSDASGKYVYRQTYDTSRDGAPAALAIELKRMSLAAIEAASGVDQAYVDVVKSMKLTTATTEELDAAIVQLSKISQVKDAFENLGLGADAVTTGLINAAGGIDALATMSSSYYDNFYTEAEKHDKTLASVTEAFTGLGMTLPTTREAFRSIVEGLDLTTASGQSTFVSLMNVQGAFVSVTGAADTASAAVANLALSSMSGYEAFVAKYYNSAEQQAMHGAHLAETFGKLNLTMPTTLAGFRGLVEGLDLTTEDGQQTAQALLNASGEFYDYIKGIDATGDAASGAANQIQQAVESINSISVGVGEIYEQGISEANAFQSSLAGLTTGMSYKDSLALQIGEITKQLQYFTIRPGAVGDGYGGATLGGHNYLPGELDSIRDQFARILATMSGDMAEFVTYSAQYSSGVAEQLVALNNWKEQQAGTMMGNATLLAALDESYKRQYGAIIKGGGAAGAASGTSSLSSLSSLLHQTLGTMQAAILPELHRNQAKAEIETALAIAKASGVLPKAEDLRDALATASKLGQSGFTTAADYQREYLRTMGTISELSALTDGQLSVEEQTLAATNNVVAAVNNVAAILQPTRLPPIEIGELVAEIKGLRESQRKSDDAVQQLLARIAVDQRVVRQIAEKSDAIGPAPARAEA